MNKMVCFGEVLWDIFPAHEKIGGAPLNVAIRLQSLGNNVSVISRIGTEEKGNKILDLFKEKDVNIEGVQIDQQCKTGEVKVILNEKGSASYDIMYPRAWDKIELTEAAKSITKKSDAFIFGSLVSRDNISRNTLFELLKLANYKIFDVNLRPPYYTMEVLKELMHQADFIKFNDDEIFEIAEELNSNQKTLEETILFIANETNAETICVTKGSHGAILYYNHTFYHNNGYKIQVVDTVGAGDSFLASIVNQLSKGIHPQKALNFACAVGAIVAQNKGANPKITPSEIDTLINKGLNRLNF